MLIQPMKPNNTKLGLYVLILLLLVVGVSSLFSEHTSKFFNEKETKPEVNQFITSQNSQLGELILKNINKDTGDYAVFIESLNRVEPPESDQSSNVLGTIFNNDSPKPEGYEYKSTEVFPSASLYKLVLLAAALKQIQDGKLSPDSQLTATKDYLTARYGAVDFGYEDSDDQISYSVDQVMTRISTISDNFAAILLTDKVIKIAAESQIKDPLTGMAHNLGMNQTHINKDELTTSAKDIGIFFQHLYKGEVVSKSASDKIIDLLSQSKINNRIPDQLPEDVKVAHKTGELAGVRHDAGIVFLDTNPYLIVLMSQNLEDETEGIQTLSDLSKDVFEFFKNQPTPTPTPSDKK